MMDISVMKFWSQKYYGGLLGLRPTNGKLNSNIVDTMKEEGMIGNKIVSFVFDYETQKFQMILGQ